MLGACAFHFRGDTFFAGKPPRSRRRRQITVEGAARFRCLRVPASSSLTSAGQTAVRGRGERRSSLKTFQSQILPRSPRGRRVRLGIRWVEIFDYKVVRGSHTSGCRRKERSPSGEPSSARDRNFRKSRYNRVKSRSRSFGRRKGGREETSAARVVTSRGDGQIGATLFAFFLFRPFSRPREKLL